jgi:hypothetical protein
MEFAGEGVAAAGVVVQDGCLMWVRLEVVVVGWLGV